MQFVYQRYDTLTNLFSIEYLAAVVFFAVLPFAFDEFVASQLIVYIIFALAFNLMMGYSGEASFGHAAFFGAGAYGTMLFINYVMANLILAMLTGILAAIVVSVLIGYVSLRRRGVYFAMITLALAQMLYFAALQLRGYTGGVNGLGTGLLDLSVGGVKIAGGGLNYYVAALGLLLISWMIMLRIVHSPFGRTIKAIHENEGRTIHLGYNSDHYLLVMFVFSGMFSGLAGAMYAILYQFVTPDVLFWELSGDILLMTILGGVGTFGGMIIGTGIFIYLSERVSTITRNWPLIFGIVFIFVIMVAPEGVYGKYLELRGNGEGKSIGDVLKDLFDNSR